MALVLDTRDVETRQWLESIGRPEIVVDREIVVDGEIVMDRDVVIDLRDPSPSTIEPQAPRSAEVRFFAAGVACCGLLLVGRQLILRRRRRP